VAKHRDASTVWVTLKREGPTLSLEVRDDGSGIETLATTLRDCTDRAPQFTGRRNDRGRLTLASSRGKAPGADRLVGERGGLGGRG